MSKKNHLIYIGGDSGGTEKDVTQAGLADTETKRDAWTSGQVGSKRLSIFLFIRKFGC